MKKLIIIALALVALLAIGITGSILASPGENIISNQVNIVGIVENQSSPPISGGSGGSSLPNISGLHVTDSGYVMDDAFVRSTNGNTELTIPEGTIARDKNGNALHSVRIDTLANIPPLPEGNNVIGIPCEFSPSGATFYPTITISFKYDTSNVPENSELTIVFWNGSEWVELTDIVVDPVNGTVSGKTTHFTKFALISVPKPIITVTPTPTTVTTPIVTTTPVVTTAPVATTTPIVTTTTEPTQTVTPTEITKPTQTITTMITPNKDNNIAIIIFSIAIVMLVIVLVVLVIVKNKNRNRK